MPRASAEARGARTRQVGGKPPPTPVGFGEREAKIWHEIVRAKPVGWFDAGSLPLLGQYCRTLVLAEKISAELATLDLHDDGVASLEKRLVKLTSSCTSLATKLRLSVQAAVERHSRLLDETGGEKVGDNLLGGTAVWGRGEKLRATG